ncbi:FAD synthase [Natrinema marinum]|uniref:FAD synthase n=1 Tax=Natrinema marinum TaxID=2961598 RepID=UPI0020C835E1|nr:FAD synthase [Natrinema marinum]
MTDGPTADGSTGRPTRVVAQGTFDLLHPGHVGYLEQAAAAGDELHVIVARAASVTHKPDPVLSGEQRRDAVAALEAVDHARLGHTEDFSIPIREIDPDVLVLGHDQHHDASEIERALADWGIDCRVERARGLEPSDEGLYSSSDIVDRILAERGRDPSERQATLEAESDD